MEALYLGALKLRSLGTGHGRGFVYGWGYRIPKPVPRTAGSTEQEELVQSILRWQAFGSKPVCYAVASKAATKTRSPKKRKKGATGLFQSYTLSPELRAFVGEEKLSRAEVSKRLWDHIRKNNLQDPDNKRKIFCDEELRTLFGMDVTDMFQMNKLISKHIETPERSSVERMSKDTKVSSGVKDVKPSGLFTPKHISKELQAFLGLAEAEVARPQAVKLLWDYIKENKLQDPANKRNIICDENLRALLQCETFHGFHMSRYLSPHFLKES